MFNDLTKIPLLLRPVLHLSHQLLDWKQLPGIVFLSKQQNKKNKPTWVSAANRSLSFTVDVIRPEEPNQQTNIQNWRNFFQTQTNLRLLQWTHSTWQSAHVHYLLRLPVPLRSLLAQLSSIYCFLCRWTERFQRFFATSKKSTNKAVRLEIRLKTFVWHAFDVVQLQNHPLETTNAFFQKKKSINQQQIHTRRFFFFFFWFRRFNFSC